MVELNFAMKAAPLRFASLLRDISNVAVRSGKGLPLKDVWDVCRDSAIANVARQAHHHSVVVVLAELQCMLDNMHKQYGVCGHYLVPCVAFATHPGTTWIDRLL